MSGTILTNDHITAAASDAGGWSRSQLALIGVPWPPQQGWRTRAVGKTIPEGDLRAFLALRDARRKTKRKRTGGSDRGEDRAEPKLLVDTDELESPWLIRFDGGVENNGSADATGKWAFQLFDPDGNPFSSASGPAFGSPVTNNTAEFEALYEGLCRLPFDASGVLIEGDSDLVVRLITGKWAAHKPEMRRWRDRVLSRLDELGTPWSARWIPRDKNEACDAMTH